jgi:hypothetical protein
MPSLKTLVAEIKDPNDYDGVLFIPLNGSQLATIGFTGKLPPGIDQRSFVYRLLMEAGYHVAFPPTSGGKVNESKPPHD